MKVKYDPSNSCKINGKFTQISNIVLKFFEKKITNFIAESKNIE